MKGSILLVNMQKRGVRELGPVGRTSVDEPDRSADGRRAEMSVKGAELHLWAQCFANNFQGL